MICPSVQVLRERLSGVDVLAGGEEGKQRSVGKILRKLLAKIRNRGRNIDR